MARGIYQNAETLCGMLDAEGLAEVAATLRDDIAAGSTGTEIFMALRYHCRQLLSTRRASHATQARAGELADALDRALEEASRGSS